MGHDHASGRADDRRRMWIVVAISSAVIVVEVIGAIVSGSLALLADAGHVLTDVAALLLALAASYVATRPADDRRTFGYHRAEVLAALANAVVLVLVCGYVVWSAIDRLRDPGVVDGGPMLAFGLVGLIVNLIAVRLLIGGTSINTRAAYLEVLGDALGSGAVVVAAGVIMATGWNQIDPIASLLIAAMILPRALAIIREASGVLLESTPAGLDLDEVREHLLTMPEVVDVHDLHAWTITSGLASVSAHVAVADDSLLACGPLLDRLSECLRVDFGIEHATFQVEPTGHRSHEDLGPAH